MGNPNAQPVHLTPGLRVQWTAVHDLFITQITDVSASTIDSWYADNANVMDKWPKDEPCRALLDFAFNERIYVTPRAKAYAEGLFSLHPGLNGRVALLSRPSLSAESIQRFVRQQSNKGVMGAVFFDRNKAIAWLEEA